MNVPCRSRFDDLRRIASRCPSSPRRRKYRKLHAYHSQRRTLNVRLHSRHHSSLCSSHACAPNRRNHAATPLRHDLTRTFESAAHRSSLVLRTLWLLLGDRGSGIPSELVLQCTRGTFRRPDSRVTLVSPRVPPRTLPFARGPRISPLQLALHAQLADGRKGRESTRPFSLEKRLRPKRDRRRAPRARDPPGRPGHCRRCTQ
mmetsp:Transcript_14167/g.44683  ORF Transcript_14167/g.44683 Transcript_14167/m.44683 type:complete len:202 (+) Transcript_14167:722-1327(+)